MKQEKNLKQELLKLTARGLNFAAEKSASKLCLFVSYEPKIPQALKKQKSN